uniref:Uncharacterized protein n=1 Tax=Tanacetum cinerariifolium TaxID=118510 RepID=A0A699GMU6_TANCI|nr:hypothetical protein [Tanacetum cinerariifolium]
MTFSLLSETLDTLETSSTSLMNWYYTGGSYVPIYDFQSDKESWGDSDEEDDHEDDFKDDADNNDDDSDDNHESDDKRTKSDRDEILNPNLTNVDQTEHEEEDVDERVYIPLDYELTDDEKIQVEENINEEEEDEVTKELYDDMNVNLGHEDTKMTNKTRGPTQSSSVSFDFTSKLLNLDNPSPANNEIAALMDTTAYHATTIPEITSSFTTPTPPRPPLFNPLSQQATPTPTPTASEIMLALLFSVAGVIHITTSLPALPDFAYVFNFNERVTKLEKVLSEIKQVDQYAQALSSIPVIVDRYMDNKLREAINKAIQAHNFDYREEAQAKKREYIELINLTVRTNIKEEVNTQLPQILPQAISDVATLSLYKAAASLSMFKLTRILIDKMEKNKSFDIADYKRELYDALVKSYNTDKDIFESYGEAFSLKRSRYDKDKDQDPFAGSDQGTKRRKSSKDVKSSRDSRSQVTLLKTQACNKIKSSSREIMMNNPMTRRLPKPNGSRNPGNLQLLILIGGPKCQSFYGYASNMTSSKDVYSKRRVIAVTRLKIMKKCDYGHLKEIEVRRDDQKQHTFKEGDFKRLRLQDIEDLLLLLVQQKLTNLTIDEWYDLNVVLHMYTRHIVIQRRVEDLQLGVEGYQKKLNLTKPDTYISNLKNKTAYTSYSDPHEIIYMDQYKRKRLMRTDELHKFSDGTLNDVRSALYDIVAGIRMKYLPMKKWSNLDKKRAQVMFQDIHKQLYQRRLMRNLEKFVGGRVYGNDLRLLERTI